MKRNTLFVGLAVVVALAAGVLLPVMAGMVAGYASGARAPAPVSSIQYIDCNAPDAPLECAEVAKIRAARAH